MGEALHQFIIGATPGDAITDHARLLQRWLRVAGFEAEIYAESIHPALKGQIHPLERYRPARPGERVLLHHSIGSQLVENLLGKEVRFILIYHNITPPEFFEPFDPQLALQLRRGLGQLQRLRERTVLALADSAFNAATLRQLGYPRVEVLPIVLDPAAYGDSPNPDLLARYADGAPHLLFVGRLVPNKRQEDLIKLLYFYRRMNPTARLFLVGAPWVPSYAEWLREFAEDLGLEEAVVFAGHVSQQDLVTYYRLADVYVSMSEHEGFGKPLIESMYFDVPVVAYAAAGVPETLGGAGVLVSSKHYEAVAEFIEILRTDKQLRHRLLEGQRQRVRDFLEPVVHQRWWRVLASMLNPPK